MPGERIEQHHAFNLVIEQGNADRRLRVLGRKNVNCVAAHAKSASLKVKFVAAVLHGRQAHDYVALGHLLAHANVQHHLVIVVRVANAVNRGNRADDDAIAPLHQ